MSTPSDVFVATKAFGNPHNAEIIAYLVAHPEATFGRIFTTLRDRGVDVVKGTLSARLRNLETTGVILGDPSPEERGRGKVVRYSLDARRLTSSRRASWTTCSAYSTKTPPKSQLSCLQLRHFVRSKR